MRFFTSIFIILSCSVTFAQNWANVSNNKFSYQIERVLYDSIHNKLIVSSKFMNHIGPLNARGVASWNGSVWDTLKGGINTHTQNFQPYPGGLLTAGTSYNGKWLGGGIFSSIGNVNTTGLALWDGIKWDSLPKRGFRYGQNQVISGFLKKGNLLYIIGQFDSIAGQATNGIATWDGTNFNPILLPIDQGSFNGISSIVEYQGEIYIAGGYFFGGVGDVLKYNGISWVSTTTGGFIGPYSGPRQLIVYNNELYAAGYFEKSYGNPGNNVIKWNGTQWKDVGFGSTASYVEINKMLVFDNKLWAFGMFNKVANKFTSNVAVYDGISWCGFKDTLDNAIGGATIYKDTIYISGGFWKANSDSIPFLAKLKNPNLYNTCVNVGIEENTLSKTIKIFPNPASEIITIKDEQNELNNSVLTISNSIGQTVMQLPFTNVVDVGDLTKGYYFLNISTPNRRVLHSKFIKE